MVSTGRANAKLPAVKAALRTRTWISAAALGLLLCPALPVGAEALAQAEPAAEAEVVEQSPEAPIRRLNAALIDIMKSAEGGAPYSGRYAIVAPVVRETFDVLFMAAKSIGGHWRKLDAEQRKRWVKTFEDFTISNFADRFDGFSGQSFEIAGERPASRDTRVVETLLNRPGDEAVELDYRMSARAGNWRVVDIYSDGSVSEVALRRSEYKSVLKGGGIDALIAAVEAKTAKRAAR